MGQFGTEYIEKALKFAGNLTNAVVNALEDDGKIKGAEFFQIAMTLPGLLPVVRNIDVIVDEYYDLDDAEMERIKEFFAKEFDIPNDQVEVKIEKAFTLILALGDSVLEFLEPTTKVEGDDNN